MRKAQTGGELDGRPPDGGAPGGAVECLSEHLRFRISRGGQEFIRLVFVARHIDDFAGDLDDDIRRVLDERGIDLDAIIAGAKRNHYAPGTLFELQESQTNSGVRLWLELAVARSVG